MANDSHMPSFGAPAFCLSAPSSQCAPSLLPQQKQLKISKRCWTLDSLRGVALSSIKNSAIQQPSLSRESQKSSRHSPETDRPRAGPLFAAGEYQAYDNPSGDALQFVCRRKTFEALFAPLCGRLWVLLRHVLVGARSTKRFRWPAHFNASTPSRSYTMIFRAWITMISDAVVPPVIRFSAKASPFSPVTHY